MKTRYTVIAVIAVLIVIFIVQNTTEVEIRFLVWSLGMSRALLVILLITAGGIIGWSARSREKHRIEKKDKKI